MRTVLANINMKVVFNIIKHLRKLALEHRPEFVNLFFWFFVISFCADRIINHFVHFPFFVISALLIFPLLFYSAQYQNPQKRQLYVLIFSFLIMTILDSIVYLFGIKNISDFLFISLFITIYFYYRDSVNNLKFSNVYLFLIISLFLFSFTFFEIDSTSINNTEYSTVFIIDNVFEEQLGLLNNNSQIAETKGNAPKSKTIKWKSNPLDILEYFRIYHNGLFRLPHVASYFFGFLVLFFAYQYQKKKKLLDIILLAVSLVVCVYTGSRAVLVAFVLSFTIFLFKRKYIIYLQGVIIFILLLILGRQYLVQLTEDTVFYQYFAFIQTTLENFTRLSRFRLLYSWWLEVREFGFWDFMTGKSYTNALIANAENLDYKVWFHNDFLNIFYTYGIWCTILYIWFFIKIYRDNKSCIKKNIFIFIFYISMVITALINGFYYYFPVFLLYLFFIMIKQEHEIIKIEL